MNITQVDLNIVVPTEPIRMVLMQPFVRFPENPTEPYRWDTAHVAAQKTAIENTLAISKGDENITPATFTVFPEYAIPGLEGVDVVDAGVRSAAWPPNTVVIAGVDGLHQSEYRTLCDGANSAYDEHNAPDRVQATEWVNCCVTWVKMKDGSVQRWIQPKIRPAWPEQNIRHQMMYKGKGAYVFSAPVDGVDFECRFLTLICYDWVCKDAGRLVWNEVVGALAAQVVGFIQLHWVFVIQRNIDPNHCTFLENTRDCFNNAVNPRVDRTHAAIVLANVAAGPAPCRALKGGFSAIVYRAGSPFNGKGCLPSVSTRWAKHRGAGTLGAFTDAVFRECGECVHSFHVRIPNLVDGSPADRHPPVESAATYVVIGDTDPRRPNGPVPAAVKWVNDELDLLECLTGSRPPQSKDVAQHTKVAHEECVGVYRVLSDKRLVHRMERATSQWFKEANGKRQVVRRDADDWATDELTALTNQVHVLALLTLAYGGSIDVSAQELHALLRRYESPCLSIAVVSGPTHIAVARYVRENIAPINHAVLIVSCDEAKSPLVRS